MSLPPLAGRFDDAIAKLVDGAPRVKGGEAGTGRKVSAPQQLRQRWVAQETRRARSISGRSLTPIGHDPRAGRCNATIT
jgi:hypothetical protein